MIIKFLKRNLGEQLEKERKKEREREREIKIQETRIKKSENVTVGKARSSFPREPSHSLVVFWHGDE